MSKIVAVVFDLDGLMFNTEEIFNETGTELLRRRGISDVQPVIERMMGRRAHEAFEQMITMCQLPETIEELQEESEEIFQRLLPERVAPMPGLYELLEQIEARKLPKGVATSSGRNYLEGLLKKFDLFERFDMTLTSEDVTHGKPHPEIYLTASQRLNANPEQVLVLEDSGIGTKAAVAAGTHIVSVPHVFSRNQDFSGTRHIASSLVDPYILNLLN